MQLKKAAVIVAASAAVAGVALPAAATAPEKMDIKAGEAHGFVPVHGAKSQAHRGGSPLMTLHGGAIMPSSTVKAIFWGTNWSNSSFVSDKQSGLDTWYGGFGGSKYADASDEYSGSNKASVTSQTTYQGHLVDTSAAPKGQPSVSAILTEVAKLVPTPSADGLGYYPVYVDQPRGGAQFCAWHSYGSINGTPVQVAFFFNLDGDPGCDPGADSSVTQHTQGLDALANVSAHELSEARTDPRNGGWYDSSGAENGDKCAWAFPPAAYGTVGADTWLMQGEWSNKRFTAGTGLPNLSGQPGCIFSKA